MKYALVCIIIIALVLRLVNINQSLWLDEGINAVFAGNLSFRQLIFDYPLGDFHPPLYHVILKVFILIFGNSEFFLRLPSVLFGTMTVFVTYLIGKSLFDVRTGLIGALLLSTSPLGIYYSQEARMYS